MNNDIRPLKDVIEIRGGFPIEPVLILFLAALTIMAFVYFKKRKGKKEEPLLPPRPAEEIARSALKALKEMRLAEKKEIKEYYIRLSDIIRIYVENRYKIFAMDRTTWELFQELKSKRIERLHAEKINDFLEECDMVKFAKYTPNEKEMEEAYNKAEEIVEITTNNDK